MDNIRMNIKEMGINTMNWVDSVQDRDYFRAIVNAALNLISHGVTLVSHQTAFKFSCLVVLSALKDMSLSLETLVCLPHPWYQISSLSVNFKANILQVHP